MKVLVIGGSVSISSGNRLVEPESQLDYAREDVQEKYLKHIQNSTTVDELASTLYSLAHMDLNIVGSRGYCYKSDYIADLIKNRNPEFNLITRTGGLREKYKELYIKEKANE